MKYQTSLIQNAHLKSLTVAHAFSLIQDFVWGLLSCMHRPVQPKNLSWWGEVGNSLIFQHSPSHGGSLRPQTWNRSEQQLFYLIALTRIRTRDLWLWYHIELHAPTSSTQKLKLMGRGGQFTYIPTVETQDRAVPYIFICFFVLADKGYMQPKCYMSFCAGLLVCSKRTQAFGIRIF